MSTFYIYQQLLKHVQKLHVTEYGFLKYYHHYDKFQIILYYNNQKLSADSTHCIFSQMKFHYDHATAEMNNSLAFFCGSLGLIPDQVMWDLWWTK
jgi:hypothetical protein